MRKLEIRMGIAVFFGSVFTQVPALAQGYDRPDIAEQRRKVEEAKSSVPSSEAELRRAEDNAAHERDRVRQAYEKGVSSGDALALKAKLEHQNASHEGQFPSQNLPNAKPSEGGGGQAQGKSPSD